MQITSKRIITQVTVEIGFNEFWGKLNELVTYWLETKEVKPTKRRYNEHATTVMSSFYNNYIRTGRVTMETAKEIFENTFSDIGSFVLLQIAEDNGYEVSHYGIYDSVLKIRTATFFRNGSHI